MKLTQRDLAEFAYDKKEEYGVTHGLLKMLL